MTDKETFDELGAHLLDPSSFKRIKRKLRWEIIVPWTLCVLLTCISLFLAFLRYSRPDFGSFHDGFATDFKTKERVIKLENTQFTGSPIFSNGEELLPLDSPSLKYVGDPSPEVDSAWEKLIHSRYFYITEKEAANAWGDNYRDYWDPKRKGFVAGFDMFHTLHCIDHIRKAFYPDIYQMSDIHGRLHRDHCIDHLRQTVMCYSDMTLIPTVYYESLGYNYINSDRNHTCRNFHNIREYTTERSNGRLAIRPYIMIES